MNTPETKALYDNDKLIGIKIKTLEEIVAPVY
jgi:hypothetical protein